MFYEAAADLVYPVDPVVSAAILTLVLSVSSGVYTMLDSRVSSAAMNWTLTGVCVCLSTLVSFECTPHASVFLHAFTGSYGVCGLLMLVYTETRVRQRVDEAFGSADKPKGRAHSGRVASVNAPDAVLAALGE